jgi:hypothetical protein
MPCSIQSSFSRKHGKPGTKYQVAACRSHKPSRCSSSTTALRCLGLQSLYGDVRPCQFSSKIQHICGDSYILIFLHPYMHTVPLNPFTCICFIRIPTPQQHFLQAYTFRDYLANMLIKKNQIGDHALPRRGFGLSTPSGAERKGATLSNTRHRRPRESRQRASHEPRSKHR